MRAMAMPEQLTLVGVEEAVASMTRCCLSSRTWNFMVA